MQSQKRYRYRSILISLTGDPMKHKVYFKNIQFRVSCFSYPTDLEIFMSKILFFPLSILNISNAKFKNILCQKLLKNRLRPLKHFD